MQFFSWLTTRNPCLRHWVALGNMWKANRWHIIASGKSIIVGTSKNVFFALIRCDRIAVNALINGRNSWFRNRNRHNHRCGTYVITCTGGRVRLHCGRCKLRTTTRGRVRIPDCGLVHIAVPVVIVNSPHVLASVTAPAGGSVVTAQVSRIVEKW